MTKTISIILTFKKRDDDDTEVVVFIGDTRLCQANVLLLNCRCFVSFCEWRLALNNTSYRKSCISKSWWNHFFVRVFLLWQDGFLTDDPDRDKKSFFGIYWNSPSSGRYQLFQSGFLLYSSIFFSLSIRASDWISQNDHHI